MPDITMCTNEKCVKRLKCYRFTAQAGTRQSYTEFKPTKNGRKYFHCDSSWPVDGVVDF